MGELEQIRITVTDAETAQRGYLLTGNKEFLNRYHDAQRFATEAYANVRVLTIDNASQQNSLPELQELVNERFYYLDKSIKAKGENAPILPENLEKGYELMNKMRGLVESMREREQTLLVSRTADLNKFSAFTPPLILEQRSLPWLLQSLSMSDSEKTSRNAPDCRTNWSKQKRKLQIE